MQLPTSPVPRRKPFLPRESSSKRVALALALVAVAVGLGGAWYLQMRAEAGRGAASGASTQPAGAMADLDAIEKIQTRADVAALDGFGRDSVLRFQGLWNTRSYPIASDLLGRMPVSLVVQNEPGTKRSLHAIRVEHAVWRRVASRLGVAVESQTSTAFAGTLARPDGRARVAFVDLRLIDAPLPEPVRIEARVMVCTPPEPGMDFAIARAGEWMPLVEFPGRDLLAFRAARVQVNGTPLLDHAMLLVLDDAGTPTRFELTIDNVDGASLQRLP